MMQKFWQAAIMYSRIAIGIAAVTSTASATATGSQVMGGFDFETPFGVTVHVPECQLYHEIFGSGKKITQEMAQVNCAVTKAFSLCNWRIDFHYADTNGNTYKIDRVRRTPTATPSLSAKSKLTTL